MTDDSLINPKSAQNRGVKLDELCREKGNRRSSLSERYVSNQSEVKNHFNDAIDSGDYLQNAQSYKEAIDEAHKLAFGAADGDNLYYQRTNSADYINNSVFMNKVNSMLKKAGMTGIPQGILDHAAQRLQPDSFIQYFIDFYKANNLGLANAA